MIKYKVYIAVRDNHDPQYYCTCSTLMSAQIRCLDINRAFDMLHQYNAKQFAYVFAEDINDEFDADLPF